MSAPAPGGSPSPPSSAPPPALSPPSSASPPAPSPPSSAPPPAPSPPSPPSGTPAPSPPSPSAPGPSPPSVPAAPPLQPSAPPQPPVMPGPPSSSSPPQPPVTPAAPPASSPPTPPAASPPKPDPPGPPKSPLPQAPPADPPASSPPPPAAPLPTPSPPPVTPAPSPPSPSPPAPSPPSPSPPAPSAPSPSPPVTPPTPSASPPVTPLPSPSPPVTPQPPTPSPPSPVTPQPPTPSPPPVTPLPPTPSPPSPVTPQAPTPSPPSPVTPLPPTPSPPSPSPPTPSQPPPAVPAPTTPPAPLPPGSPPTTPSPAPPKRSPSPPSTAPSPPGFTSPPAGSPPSPPSTSPPSLSPISSSPSPTSSPSPSAPSGTVIAIAAAVAAVVVLGLVAGLFYFCRRRRRRRPPPTGPGDLYGARLPVTSHQKSHSLSPQLTSTPPAMYTPWQSSGGAGAGSSWPLTPTPPPPPVTGGTVSYADLEAATGGFSDGNLLGQGGFGHVYRGTLQDGQEVAIKKLRPGGGQGEREFHAEVEIISRVHHRNLVSLVGYCIYGDQRLLVYEYVPNKTLEFHLHGSGRATLDWPRRWKIAVGAAKGLAYLHEDCRPKIIHRDIKAANILLDYNFEPKVADFGLAKIQPGDDTHVSTRVMGTFGYLAPEYATTGKVNDRSDVFSFGVVLLELITGRRPVVSTEPYNDETLVSWARPLLTRALEEQVFDELIDPKLAANYDAYDMQRLITCAAGAVRHTARSRPRMSQIVRYLEGELSMEDLNAGVAPGQSLLHSQEHSGDTTELISRIRRMAFVLGTGTVTEDANSDYLSELTSEYGLYPSSSSSGGGDAGEAGTQTATSQPHHGAAEEAATQHYSGEVSGAAEAMSRRTRPGSTGRSA